MRAKGMSARSLSKAAGLSPDAARNLLSGRSVKPHQSTLEALAKALDVTVADLDTAGVPSDAPTRSTPAEIKEIDLRPVEGSGGDILQYRVPLAVWSLPSDLLAARGLQADKTVILRAQGGIEGVAAGDRLVVDLSQRSLYPPGLAVVWLEESDGYDLVKIEPPSKGLSGRGVGGMTAELTFSWGSVQWPPSEVHVVGRVVGRWQWL
jgi:transcriptional regulator with XRE-family HTH domain